MTDTLTLLRNTSMFGLLDDAELTTTAGLLRPCHFAKEEVIFARGDVGDSLYIIQKGRIEIFVESIDGEKISFAEYEAGEIIGEISMLDGGNRTATAVAKEDSDLLAFDREDVLALVRKHPDAALDMLAVIGKRLRVTNELLRNPVARNLNVELAETLTLGERVADRVASFGGSWSFVFLFSAMLIGWMVVNAWYASAALDPFPFILLNLGLSALAALQAPIIMMSQNRHSAKDRLRADLDYEVNLKAELEIAHLHRKVDQLHERLLTHLAAGSPANRSAGR